MPDEKTIRHGRSIARVFDSIAGYWFTDALRFFVLCASHRKNPSIFVPGESSNARHDALFATVRESPRAMNDGLPMRAKRMASSTGAPDTPKFALATGAGGSA
jgi:hypothetical protein